MIAGCALALAVVMQLPAESVPLKPDTTTDTTLKPDVSTDAQGADRLWIDAVAVDRGGVPVMDLQPEDLEVWINGFRIPIETLVAVTPDTPAGRRTMILVLDDVSAGPILASRVKETARQFVTRMSSGDRMSIVTLSGEATEPTGDSARLLRAIDAYQFRGFPVRVDDAGQLVLRTVTAISRQLVEIEERRKTIVAIGAGWLLDRPVPPPGAVQDLRADWYAAMRAAASANVGVYVLDPTGLGTTPYADGGSQGFARETGGHAFVNTNDVKGAITRIWREAATYYLIGVTNPPFGRKEDLRELDVRTLRRGIAIRARRGVGP